MIDSESDNLASVWPPRGEPPTVGGPGARRGLPGGVVAPGSPQRVAPKERVSEKERAAAEVTSSRDAFQAELLRVAAEQEAEREERRRLERRGALQPPGPPGLGGADPGPAEWAATNGLKVLGGASALVDRSSDFEKATREGAQTTTNEPTDAGWKGWGGDDADERGSNREDADDGDTDGTDDVADVRAGAPVWATYKLRDPVRPGRLGAQETRGQASQGSGGAARARRAAAAANAVPEGTVAYHSGALGGVAFGGAIAEIQRSASTDMLLGKQRQSPALPADLGYATHAQAQAAQAQAEWAHSQAVAYAAHASHTANVYGQQMGAQMPYGPYGAFGGGGGGGFGDVTGFGQHVPQCALRRPPTGPPGGYPGGGLGMGYGGGMWSTGGGGGGRVTRSRSGGRGAGDGGPSRGGGGGATSAAAAAAAAAATTALRALDAGGGGNNGGVQPSTRRPRSEPVRVAAGSARSAPGRPVEAGGFDTGPDASPGFAAADERRRDFGRGRDGSFRRRVGRMGRRAPGGARGEEGKERKGRRRARGPGARVSERRTRARTRLSDPPSDVFSPTPSEHAPDHTISNRLRLTTPHRAKLRINPDRRSLSHRVASPPPQPPRPPQLLRPTRPRRRRRRRRFALGHRLGRPVLPHLPARPVRSPDLNLRQVHHLRPLRPRRLRRLQPP